jgi:tetratricopeptide (TPR) repeat protein
MKLNSVQQRINELFSIFVTEIRGAIAMNRTDLNLVAEQVLLPVFSIVFSCSRLQNLNHTQYSMFPAIDLGDEEARIAFQVTATNTSDKITDTLAKFVKYELYKKYDRLIIYILTQKRNSYSSKQFQEIHKDNFRFDKDRDILDYRDLLKAISSFPLQKVAQIKDVLEQNLASNPPNVFSGLPQRELQNEPGQLLFSVPFERNPNFSGRDLEIEAIHDSLKSSNAKPLAVHGLPGVGKTQTVLEYCFRNRDEYSAIAWIESESEETILKSFVQAATIAGVSCGGEGAYASLIKQVCNLIQSRGSGLLVFDNLDDFQLLKRILPSDLGCHIILTTRARGVGGIGRGLEIRPMMTTAGAQLLLQRAQMLDSSDSSDRLAAQSISIELGGLPLALDQAAAFIEEVPSSPAEYLKLYRLEGKHLRNRRGGVDPDHASVTITFLLALRRLEILNAAAVDLIRLSAFLASEIPEEILTVGGPVVGGFFAEFSSSPLNLPNTIGDAARLSLIRREPQRRVFYIHRLVQDVIKDEMTNEEKRRWAECVLRMLHATFPEPEYSLWPICSRLSPQARIASSLIQQCEINLYEAAELMNRFGVYFYHLGIYGDSEHYYRQALSIVEKRHEEEEAICALIVNNLAVLCKRSGRYAEAEALYKRALDIQIKVFGETHSHVATTLNNLGNFYRENGKFGLAESFLVKSLNIRKLVQGPTHPDVAESLHNLGNLHKWTGDLEAAKAYLSQALQIRKENLAPNDPRIANTLNSLANVYRRQDQFVEAESLMKEALEIRKRSLGPRHLDTAQSLKDLAVLYNGHGDFKRAKVLLLRSLVIRTARLKPDSLEVGNTLNSLAYSFQRLGEFAKAEKLYLKALEIRQKVYGFDSHLVYACLTRIAELYAETGQDNKAETLFAEAISGLKRTLGPKHPEVADALEHLASIFIKKDDFATARDLLQQAATILEQVSGANDRHRTRILLKLARPEFNT